MLENTGLNVNLLLITYEIRQTVDHAGHMAQLKHLMIESVLQQEVNFKHYYLLQIPLLVVMEYTAFHLVAMVVRLEHHGLGLRKQGL